MNLNKKEGRTMSKLYFYERRNFNKQLVSRKEVKLNLYLIQFGKCNYCKKNRNKISLEIDHILPLYIGSPETDYENMQLLCYDCHKEKTRKDILVYSAFKRLKIISGTNQKWESTLYYSNRRKLYLKFLALLEYSEIKIMEYLIS